MREIASETVAEAAVDHQPGASPLQLPPEAASAGRARRYIRDCLLAMGRPELVECAVLGVDELVANVCIHAHTSLVLTVLGDLGHPVRIEVTDYSANTPVRRTAAGDSLGGRGLTLLDACGSWGLGAPPTGGGKTIWFEPSATME
jgi:anti-sigma regulatory factor (Ser/Thr protein kinase)